MPGTLDGLSTDLERTNLDKLRYDVPLSTFRFFLRVLVFMILEPEQAKAAQTGRPWLV